MVDVKTGQRRRWYFCRKTKVKRWLDNDEPVDS